MTPELKQDLKIIGFWSKPQSEKEVYTNIDVKLLMRIRDVKNGACKNCGDNTEYCENYLCPFCVKVAEINLSKIDWLGILLGLLIGAVIAVNIF